MATTNDLLVKLLEKMNDNNEILTAQQTEVLKSQKKVRVLNTVPYAVGFPTKATPTGHVLEGGKVSTDLTFEEVQQLVNDGEKIFCGVDGKGTKAVFKILDFDVYKSVFGLPEASAESYHLSEEEIKELLSIADRDAFQAALDEKITTKGEIFSVSHYLYAVCGEDSVTGWMRKAIDSKLRSLL